MTDPILTPDVIDMVTSIVALMITVVGIAFILLDNRKHRRDLEAVKLELDKIKSDLSSRNSNSA